MEESNKIHTPEYRSISVRVSNGSTIQGKVNIAGRERVSDLFTSTEPPFIVLVDAMIREGYSKILFLNKRHIIWAEPED
jgi:hypothetical protein